MSDNETPSTAPATGKGSRVANAHTKGAAAARAGKPRENPYSRPNMFQAWADGYDSVSAPAGALDVQG